MFATSIRFDVSNNLLTSKISSESGGIPSLIGTELTTVVSSCAISDMGRPLIDIVGKKFATVTVIEYAYTDYASYWKGKCELCGSIKIYPKSHLKILQSCGCLRNKASSERLTTHGQSHSNLTPEYRTWLSMRGRCLKKQHKSYKDYGGRGITICERWLKFENFFADMGKRPSAKHSIERVNNDGNYEPSNCIWLLRSEQAKNQRKSRYLEYEGERMIASDWARKLKIGKANFLKVLKRYSLSEIINAKWEAPRKVGGRWRRSYPNDKTRSKRIFDNPVT